MMPPFAVAARASAVRLHTRYIQGRLFFMALHRTSMVGARRKTKGVKSKYLIFRA